MFDYDRFFSEANSKFITHEGDHQRYGQFLMNYLHSKHPEIYSQVPEEVDPFYDNSKCHLFLCYLADLDSQSTI
jgi:hypothetical protein